MKTLQTTVTCCVCGKDVEAKDCKLIKNARDVVTHKGTYYKILTKGIMCKECTEECDKHQKEIQETLEQMKKIIKEAKEAAEDGQQSK